MIDATAITDPATLIPLAYQWLWHAGRRNDARRFRERATTVPGMNGLRQLCAAYGVPVRWHL